MMIKYLLENIQLVPQIETLKDVRSWFKNTVSFPMAAAAVTGKLTDPRDLF
jgi:hypothetical protein